MGTATSTDDLSCAWPFQLSGYRGGCYHLFHLQCLLYSACLAPTLCCFRMSSTLRLQRWGLSTAELADLALLCASGGESTLILTPHSAMATNVMYQCIPVPALLSFDVIAVPLITTVYLVTFWASKCWAGLCTCCTYM